MINSMKILLTGVSCVGKTTIGSQLEKKTKLLILLVTTTIIISLLKRISLIATTLSAIERRKMTKKPAITP